MTETQNKLLYEKEVSSFQRHCIECGWDPKNKEKEFYDQYISSTQKAMNGTIERGVPKEIAEDAFRGLLQNKNYWDLLRWTTREKKQQIIGEISKAIRRIPSNYSYLSKLSGLMKLPKPSKENPDSIIVLIKNIPVMNIFELDFNAFVIGRTTISNIPFVCYYTLLPGLIDHFVNIFLSALTPAKANEYIDFPSNEALRITAKNPEFMVCCMSGMLSLIGAAADLYKIPSMYFSEKHPQLGPELFSALCGSSYFVSFHEYGHILLGHIEMAHTLDLEHQADIFALQVLLESEKDKKLLSWRILGVAILYNVFEMLNCLDPPLDKTHPTPTERVAALDKHLPNIDLCAIFHKVNILWEPGFKRFVELSSQ